MARHRGTSNRCSVVTGADDSVAFSGSGLPSDPIRQLRAVGGGDHRRRLQNAQDRTERFTDRVRRLLRLRHARDRAGVPSTRQRIGHARSDSLPRTTRRRSASATRRLHLASMALPESSRDWIRAKPARSGFRVAPARSRTRRRLHDRMRAVAHHLVRVDRDREAFDDEARLFFSPCLASPRAMDDARSLRCCAPRYSAARD